jgi:low affinity Fe/Cu permease
VTMPREAAARPGMFDRFADVVNKVTARAWFFAACVALVVLWAPSILVFPNVDTWQLALNTPTTAITFLLVALIQNTQKRSDDAVQHKLNAIAAHLAGDTGDDELRAAVGLERHETSDD